MRHRSTIRLRRALAALIAAPALLAAAGCGGQSTGDAAQAATASSSGASGSPASELRLGYFANVTHAAALIGVQQGYFAKELGSTKLSTQVFNAGPEAVE